MFMFIYIVLLYVLGFVWFVASIAWGSAIFADGLSREDKIEEFRRFAAVAALAAVGIIAWPLVLALAIPALIIYGLKEAIVLTRNKEWSA